MCYYFFHPKIIEAGLKIIILLFAISFSILSLLTIDNYIATKKFWVFVLWKTYRFSDYLPWISAAWAGFLTASSMFVASWIFKRTETTDIISSPGFIYAVVALWFVWWTFLNTLVLIKQQNQKISGFKLFLSEVKSILENWQHNANGKKTKELFLVDYSPFIGNITIPNTQEYKQFKEELEGIANKDTSNIELRIICFNTIKTTEYFERMNCNDDNTETDILNLEVHTRENKNIAIWRTSEISPFHFIIAENIGYQYTIKPTRNGGINELMGSHTEDVFMIEFLKETYREMESIIATPDKHFDYSNDDFILLHFLEPQINIKEVNIIWGTSGKDLNKSTIDYDVSDNIKLPNSKLRSAVFRIELVKLNGMLSYPSKKCTINESEYNKRKPV